MLSRLHIENYVLIDSLDISFPGGLSIITGRTGAGKSILLGALSLVLGGKGGAEVIGAHGSGCTVEAEFEVGEHAALQAFFDENDLDWDDGRITLRRMLSAAGRSRSFVNDIPVQLGVLSGLSGLLIDIHSQDQTRLLSDAAWQLGVLDHFAGADETAGQVRRLWKQLGTLRRELEALRDRRRRAEQEKELQESRLERLREAGLTPGELEELEAEQQQLANAEEIKENLYGAESVLSPEEGGGVVSLLKEAEKSLTRAAKYVPSAEQLAERLASARVELDDIVAGVSELDEAVRVSPDRLSAVEERLSKLYSLMKLHQAGSIEELIDVRDRLAEEMSGLESLSDEEAALERRIRGTEGEYAASCETLSRARRAAAASFSAVVTDRLRFMELDRAVFRAEVSDVPESASGRDAVHFLFAADGIREAEVAKAASGGERSRIMLALKEVMAHHCAMPTLVFDEIDTGVSGSVADKMGSVICDMGKDMQVIAITHLPQVAAKGNAHFLVTRTENPATGESVTGISLLSEEDRLLEVARMLSGASLSEAAIRNAGELLKAAQA